MKINANGLPFASKGDSNSAALDGPSRAPSDANKAALAAAAAGVGKAIDYTSEGSVPRHEEVLLRMLSYLSEAPGDYQITDIPETEILR